MSRIMLAADLHLGHRNIHKYRTQFATADEHHNHVFARLRGYIKRGDSLFLLGDVAFDSKWLGRLAEIECAKKTLILGNHDTEKLDFRQLGLIFDNIHSSYNRRNCLFTHIPCHPNHFRKNMYNVHGHIHKNLVQREHKHQQGMQIHVDLFDDKRYINVCLEHIDYKPISFGELMRERDLS